MSTAFKQMMAKKPSAPIKNNAEYDPIEIDLMKEHDVVLDGDDNVFKLYTVNDSHTDNIIIVFLHGGGLTSASWFPCIQLMHHSNKSFEYCCIDLRGHGNTRTSNSTDLSIDILVSDVVNVLCKFYGENRKLILVGHSLGGSIATRCITDLQKQFQVKGLVVLDLVEGSAIGNLQFLKNVLDKRPQTFPTLQHAIKWTVNSGIVKNLMSARISVPSQFVTNEQNQYEWRTKLEKTEPYWSEWFTGLSDAFLNCGVAKMLVLANTDRLDQTLLIANMQGKFQLKVLKDDHIGHFVHEDVPKETSDALLSFFNRVHMLSQYR
jgi:protein phosphatase methylesterase 1